MNWKDIKESCPKAFKYAIDNSIHVMHTSIQLGQTRNLYDFFDENEIYILIGKNLLRGSEYFPDSDWWWNVTSGEATWIQAHSSSYDTRTEAEQGAFEKAFEIMESKIG